MSGGEQSAKPVTQGFARRRRWTLIGSGLLVVAVCIAAAVSAGLWQRPGGRGSPVSQKAPTEPEASEPKKPEPCAKAIECVPRTQEEPGESEPTEYESRAIIEVVDNRAASDRDLDPVNMAQLVTDIRLRLLNWPTIREIALSRRVDFGEEVDPEDRAALERVYDEVQKRTRIAALSHTHVTVSYRSSSPERNAALVNELVKKLVGEDRREQQERAKAELRYCRDKLAVAKSALEEIDSQVREFNQHNPWLAGTLAEIQKDYENAEAEELRVRQQIRAGEEALSDVRKELAKEKPELVKVIPGQIPPEVIEFRKAVEEARALFEQIDKRYTRAHPRWQEAFELYQKAVAALRARDVSRPEDERIVEPNPKYATLQARATELERQLERLRVQGLEANKRGSEYYIRRRKAPELLGERRALEEQRSVAAGTAAEYASATRRAMTEVERLLMLPYGSRFRVVEFARDDRRPVKGARSPNRPASAKGHPAKEPPKQDPEPLRPEDPEF